MHRRRGWGGFGSLLGVLSSPIDNWRSISESSTRRPEGWKPFPTPYLLLFCGVSRRPFPPVGIRNNTDRATRRDKKPGPPSSPPHPRVSLLFVKTAVKEETGRDRHQPRSAGERAGGVSAGQPSIPARPGRAKPARLAALVFPCLCWIGSALRVEQACDDAQEQGQPLNLPSKTSGFLPPDHPRGLTIGTVPLSFAFADIAAEYPRARNDLSLAPAVEARDLAGAGAGGADQAPVRFGLSQRHPRLHRVHPGPLAPLPEVILPVPCMQETSPCEHCSHVPERRARAAAPTREPLHGILCGVHVLPRTLLFLLHPIDVYDHLLTAWREGHLRGTCPNRLKALPDSWRLVLQAIANRHSSCCGLHTEPPGIIELSRSPCPSR
jgi:hypothetical protein